MVLRFLGPQDSCLSCATFVIASAASRRFRRNYTKLTKQLCNRSVTNDRSHAPLSGLKVKPLKTEETDMSLSSHIVELKKKHETLSVEVEHAQRAPSIDRLEIADLKRQKLRLKDEISRLMEA